MMIVIDDLRYAARILAKQPGFTALTTLVMAAGIGISLFLFSMFNTILFKDLPFVDGGSLFEINSTRNNVFEWGGMDLHDYYEVRTNLKGIAESSAYQDASVNVSGRDGARRYTAVKAEPNLFQMTRNKPILGRAFTEADNRTGAQPVVVIGHDLWQNRFGGSTEALDHTLRIDGVAHQIIGVMPRGYLFPSNAEMWLTMRRDAQQLARGDGGKYWTLAHLEPGVSLEDINKQLPVIMQRIAEQYPKSNSGIGAFANTLPMRDMRDGIAVVYSMYIVSILILVLASINVGNLLFSRAIERGRETAIRVALGAPRTRLMSQMLWESTIICTIGGLIGLMLLAWGLELTEAITATFSPDAPAFWWKFGLDGFTMTWFLIIVIGTILATGLLPAWKSSGANFNAVLRDGTRGAVGKKAGRLNRLLVISEIFLSMTVLIAAGTLILGAQRAANAEHGAITENVLTAKILLDDSNYSTPEKQVQFVTALQSRLTNSIGIGDAMIATALPGEFSWRPAIALEGKEYSDGESSSYPRANHVVVMPGSLEKLGIELQEGRYFDSRDDGLGKRSAIVTDSFALRHFPGESAIGKRIRLAEPDGGDPSWLPIVGVVRHTIQGQANDEAGQSPTFFRPYSQSPRPLIAVAVQMTADRAVATRTLRQVVQSIDPELPVFQVETYEELTDRGEAPLKFISSIMLIFGVAAVCLAASGIYGVMSNTMSQRTQEIGIKRALGAMDERITQEFLWAGCKQLLWGGIPGMLAGSVMAFAMSRIMGIAIGDLVAIVVAMVAVIGSVVMVATYIPTKRALQLEPSDALRNE